MENAANAHRRQPQPAGPANGERSAAQIASQAVAVWHEVNATLVPIIGQRGVVSLYNHCLYLARNDFPCLTAAYESALPPVEYSALQSALAQQSCALAAAANEALLQLFHDRLAQLIGESLTEHLLRPIWDRYLRASAAPETSA